MRFSEDFRVGKQLRIHAKLGQEVEDGTSNGPAVSVDWKEKREIIKKIERKRYGRRCLAMRRARARARACAEEDGFVW